MKINRFEDIIAWKMAKDLTIKIYQLMSSHKDYGFKDQIQRASVSIMNNIAEGFERKTNQEFRQFLYVAKGSCGEVRSMLLLMPELNYVDSQTAEELIAQAEIISKMLSNLIKTL